MQTRLTHTSEINESGAQINGKIWRGAKDDASMTLRDYTRLLYDDLGLKYSKFHKMDDFSRLGFLTAERLLMEMEADVPKDKLGIFLMNRYSSLQTDESFFASYSADNQGIPSPALFVYTLPNILIGEISIRHKITGEHSFFVQQDFSSEFIYLYVQTLFETAAIDAAIIGYCETTPETFGSKMGFVTLQAENEGRFQQFDKTCFENWINEMPKGKI